jgi:hypothetical protein
MREIDVSPAMLKNNDQAKVTGGESKIPAISILISPEIFQIIDFCGGISIKRAKEEVFRFGRSSSFPSVLGVYGIGLKRAIFKIGKKIRIESRTPQEGFIVDIDVENWAKNDDWEFPMTITEAAPALEDAGTKITISELNKEVVLRVSQGTLLTDLNNAIASTYALFLDRVLSIHLNKNLVTPKKLPIAGSAEATPAHKEVAWNDVSVELIAGLAERKDNEWNAERAGWYVLCNGRVVVFADKTDLTGWGLYAANFVSKYIGFVGIAFFFSKHPANLPWTTTKRGLNRDSEIYQAARLEMASIAKPVLTFLNNMYPSDPSEEIRERKIASNIKSMDISQIAQTDSTGFSPVYASTRVRKTTVSVQYHAEKSDIDKIKKKINRMSWGAGAVGKYTFDYYIKVECPE